MDVFKCVKTYTLANVGLMGICCKKVEFGPSASPSLLVLRSIPCLFLAGREDGLTHAGCVCQAPVSHFLAGSSQCEALAKDRRAGEGKARISSPIQSLGSGHLSQWPHLLCGFSCHQVGPLWRQLPASDHSLCVLVTVPLLFCPCSLGWQRLPAVANI